MTPAPRPQSRGIADQIRDEIEADRRTWNAIGTDAGLSPSSLHRFKFGLTAPTLAILESLADALGKRIVLVNKEPRR